MLGITYLYCTLVTSLGSTIGLKLNLQLFFLRVLDKSKQNYFEYHYNFLKDKPNTKIL